VADTVIEAGDLHQAIPLLERALELSQIVNTPNWYFVVTTALSPAHAPSGRMAEALNMRPLQAHCHLSLGTLYAMTSQREQARAELSAAVDLYRAMEMTFWLPQAEAALAQVPH
jgi:hypothetical protein